MELTKSCASFNTSFFQDSSFELDSALPHSCGSKLSSLPLKTVWQASSNGATTNLVFVDAGIGDYQSLLADLKPGTEVYWLNSWQDAVQQITQTLLGRSGISSLQIISHGSAGSLQLGSGGLNLGNLSHYSSQLQSWARALTANADILLYGCNVAAGEEGLAFVQQMAQLTGADVAASINLTGTSVLGGDWELEVSTGSIESAFVFNPADYVGLLANPVVTLPGGAIAYIENAPPVLIDTSATVADADNPASFNNGILTVSIMAGGIASDRLAIRNQGNSAGQIGLDGRIINFGGTQIGTFTGGIGTENLVISLNSAATPTAVTALLRNLNYFNVSDNLPAAGDRTLAIVLNDGTGELSTPVTKTVNVSGANDTPFIGNPLTLYDGTTNLLMTATGSAPGGPWFDYRDTSAFGGTATLSAGGGGTTLTTDIPISAGYSNYSFTQQNTSLTNVTFIPSPINPGRFPALDRNAGYVLSFTSQIISETRSPSANKNNDGKDDRAGFSVIVIGNDLRGIELGFWENRIWAQEDSTSQSNPALEPDSDPASNFRTLFTQAEFVEINTTTLTSYDLAILGNSYTLFSNGTPLLSGRLRDYTAFVPSTLSIFPFQVTLPDPYALPNFIFLGDNTPAAAASVRINAVSLATSAPFPAQTVNEDTPLVLPRVFVGDIDAGSNSATVTLSAANGAVTVNTSLPGGLTGSNISGNGTSTVTLTGTLAQINATLNGAAGWTYQGNPNFFGTDTLTIAVNDGGATGGSAQTTTRTLTINVNPVNDRPSFTALNPPAVNINSGLQTISNWATFNPGAANENPQMATYIVGNISNPSLFAPGGAPAIAANGTLTYTPATGVSGTSTFQVTVQDNGGTANGGQNTSITQTFTITVNPTLITNSAPVLNNSGNPTLNPVIRNSPNPVGTSVSTLISRLAGITDADVRALRGIAITGVDNTNGQWQFSTNGGVTWTNFGTPTSAIARLLADVPANRIRFVPNTGYLGTASITFRAWDQTTGSNGETANTSSNGGSTAFSFATETAIITVITPSAANSDFNGDGFADLLWRNQVTGENVLWLFDENGFDASVPLLPVDPNFTVEATRDLDRDGYIDIFWRNQATGENVLWLMNGVTLNSFVNLFPVAPGWRIAAAEDFDNDNSIDLFWRNQWTGENVFWKMNGINFQSFVNLFPVAPNWIVAAAKDFDNNGSLDILWRNQTTGENVIWKMNGFSFGSFINLFPVAPNWAIAVAEDFDGDGFVDFLWRNQTTGENVIWKMNGLSFGSFVNLFPVTPNLAIATARDLDKDGSLEIVWRNQATGENIVWVMDDFSLESYFNLSAIGPSWKLV